MSMKVTRKPEQCRDREGDERFGQRRAGAPTDLPMVGGRWRLLTAAGHLCLQIDVDHVGRLVVVHRRHIDHVRARIGDQVLFGGKMSRAFAWGVLPTGSIVLVGVQQSGLNEPCRVASWKLSN
uniref:Uncharacterized protein n=1 Tax=Anopheles coluzzii TaxID=1518534 RepID=A0A8W7Q0D6_ANOCL